VNTVPGFSPASILPQQAAAAGLTTTELLTRVLAATVERG
jgi:D-alanine-D-alanine ligase-like ATP-grasp enzyme